MMDVSKIFSEISINLLEIETATGHFANQMAVIYLSRLFEFCTSKFLLSLSMPNQSNSLFTFKGCNFIINKNAAETGCSNVFSPNIL